MLFFLTALAFLTPTHSPPVRKVTFTVEVQNIRKLTGRLEIGVFKSSNTFPDGPPAAKQSVAVDGRTVRIIFQLEPGDYAVALYQDVNSNGQIDKRLFGIPKEPYGFSNNIRPKISVPKFDECKVLVRDDARAQITLIQ